VTRNLNDANGVVTPLGGAEYRVLIELLSAQQQVLSRAQLMESASDASDLDRSIDVRVSRLRQVPGDDAREPKIIKTVYGGELTQDLEEMQRMVQGALDMLQGLQSNEPNLKNQVGGGFEAIVSIPRHS
jgi:DNA-binding winged helix-turn-helix (wHTH) protein